MILFFNKPFYLKSKNYIIVKNKNYLIIIKTINIIDVICNYIIKNLYINVYSLYLLQKILIIVQIMET